MTEQFQLDLTQRYIWWFSLWWPPHVFCNTSLLLFAAVIQSSLFFAMVQPKILGIKARKLVWFSSETKILQQKTIGKQNDLKHNLPNDKNWLAISRGVHFGDMWYPCLLLGKEINPFSRNLGEKILYPFSRNFDKKIYPFLNEKRTFLCMLNEFGHKRKVGNTTVHSKYTDGLADSNTWSFCYILEPPSINKMGLK